LLACPSIARSIRRAWRKVPGQSRPICA
jgi:hypothetical protein